ncbi:hypothetical protein [Streptomyces caniscabiei]|uniref:hypothetical protein n=1 Tax=Streptomyces caniscabiei TaxID=2746961 RepID=UPI000765BC49|nr:hypothetical protein [Streptomyces caniscabiei]
MRPSPGTGVLSEYTTFSTPAPDTKRLLDHETRDWLVVTLDAIVGSQLRYLTDRAVQAGHDTISRGGTCSINVAAHVGFGFPAGAARRPGGRPGFRYNRCHC